MKKIILSILLSVVALASYGQAPYTKAQIGANINANIRGKTYSEARMGNLLDSLKQSLAFLSGSYSNPSWITSLGWSKITGAPGFITSSYYTFTNGLTNTSGNVKLGGTLTEPTTLTATDTEPFIISTFFGIDGLTIADTYAGLTVNALQNGIRVESGTTLVNAENDVNVSADSGDVNISSSAGDINIGRSNIDGASKALSGNTEANFIIDPRVGSPSAPSNGGIWYENGVGFKFRQEGSTLSLGGGSGTVTSVGITAPAAGITVSGSPVTSSGSITLALADDLAAVEGLTTTGIVRRTASNTWSAGTGVDLTSEVTGVLPIANGGTGSSSQNFVDLTTGQTVAGNKTFTGTTSLADGTRLYNPAGTFYYQLSGSAITANKTLSIGVFGGTTGRFGVFDQTNTTASAIAVTRTTPNAGQSGVMETFSGFTYVSGVMTVPSINLTAGLVTAPSTITTTTTLSTQYVILASGTITLNLPDASSNNGRQYIIKNIGTGTITVDGNASETIDGSLTASLSVQYEYLALVCNGTEWFIINN